MGPLRQSTEPSHTRSNTPPRISTQNDQVMVLVLAQGTDGPSVVRFKMESSTPFHKMMRAWCTLCEISSVSTMFMSGPLVLGPDDTLGSIGHQIPDGNFIVHAVPRKGVEGKVALQARDANPKPLKWRKTGARQLRHSNSSLEFLRQKSEKRARREDVRKERAK